MKVAVVTPTIGSDYLEKCVKSIQNQTYENLTHYIFIDGLEHDKKVQEIIKNYDVSQVLLEENVGKGWYGHRVYAACSYLVNADVICYLDEDNWFEPNHVETLVEKIKAGADWVCSFCEALNSVTDKNCLSCGASQESSEKNYF
jgi:glycosyltransferase involved in cell wall biosynthesis